jgi:NADPH:quinone reductase-like Zn-dependent oxidoreductase
VRTIVLEKKDFNRLVLKDLVKPKPGNGQVLVKVKASALNRRDVWIIKGLYPKIEVPIILGSDGAGIVTEVGEDVDKNWLDKEVIINPCFNWGKNPRIPQKDYTILGLPENGTQAEYVVIPVSNLYKKPGYLSFEETAAIPLAGLTGYRALFTRGELQQGESLMITGIGGGVASIMLEMAVAIGAKVFVTSGDDAKIKRAMNQGAIGGANYKNEGWQEKISLLAGEYGINLIVDSAGGDGFNQLISLVNPAGRIVVYGATVGKPAQLQLHRIFWKQISIRGTTMGSDQDFKEMLHFFDNHKIKPPIHQVYSFSDYKQAYLEMMESKQYGKIVLVP